MAGLKKNLLISISTALLGVVVLFAFDTQIWISIKNLIPPDFTHLSRVFSRYGLYPYYSVFFGLIVYAFYKKNSRLKGICWAYVKAQLIFSFGVVRCMKIFFGFFHWMLTITHFRQATQPMPLYPACFSIICSNIQSSPNTASCRLPMRSSLRFQG